MIVGIDLGTTHSLIARWHQGEAQLAPNTLGEFLTPSVVALGDDGQVLVGKSARERALTHPNLAIAAFKRSMGTAKETQLGKERFRPEALSALVLKSLIADAEAAFGEKATEAIISVPAYFSDVQRKATRTAGELAGIKVERLINEPTAAALAYGLSERRENASFLVFDLGGGTFDVSILEMFDGVMEVHATAGDNYLGGEDFLDLLQKTCLETLKLDPAALTPPQLAILRSRLERLKQQLSGSQDVSLEFELNGANLQFSINETRFAELAQPLLQRIRTPIERALRDAKISPESLDEIILVGGASRMPMIPRLITRMFGRLPLRHINPDQVIALGAGVVAGMKARDVSFKEVVLTDVCPYTLGLEVSERDAQGRTISGMFSPVIERNCTVPVSKVETYSPIEDFQTVLKLRVYQGESPRVVNNVFLGELSVNLPKLKAFENSVDVRFTYDVNGLLQVEAIVNASKVKVELLIEQNPGLLSELEIRASLHALAALKIHPREDQANIALIARAERLYSEILSERDVIKSALTAFMGELESQDSARVVRARGQLKALLDGLEGSGKNLIF
jgi:molecular chaperone HscC